MLSSVNKLFLPCPHPLYWSALQIIQDPQHHNSRELVIFVIITTIPWRPLSPIYDIPSYKLTRLLQLEKICIIIDIHNCDAVKPTVCCLIFVLYDRFIIKFIPITKSVDLKYLFLFCLSILPITHIKYHVIQLGNFNFVLFVCFYYYWCKILNNFN